MVSSGLSQGEFSSEIRGEEKEEDVVSIMEGNDQKISGQCQHEHRNTGNNQKAHNPKCKKGLYQS